MKRFFFISVLVTLFTLTISATDYYEYTYTENCIEYPVIYMEDIPYYYRGRWIKLERPMYRYITHLTEKREFNTRGIPVKEHAEPEYKKPRFHGYVYGKYYDNRPNIHKPSRGRTQTPAQRYNP